MMLCSFLFGISGAFQNIVKMLLEDIRCTEKRLTAWTITPRRNHVASSVVQNVKFMINFAFMLRKFSRKQI